MPLSPPPVPAAEGHTPNPQTATSWRDRPLMTISAASDLLGVSKPSVYGLQAEGKLEFVKVSERTMVKTTSCARLIGGVDVAEGWRNRPLLPIATALRLLGISRPLIYRLRASGDLTVVKLGRRVMVQTASIVELIDGDDDWTPSNRGAVARAMRVKRAAGRRGD